MAIYNCSNTRKMEQEAPIHIFKKYIAGNFNNDLQVKAELANNKQIHPYAKHINRVLTTKQLVIPSAISNSTNNFYLLEESYYTYPGKPQEVKPYLFYFYAKGKDSVGLTVYQIPSRYTKESFTNNNPNLQLDYKELIPSSTFSGATYYYDKATKHFTTTSTHVLNGNMQFTLTETITPTQLIVMELLTKDGKQLTPYNTPIVYDRVQ